MVLHGIAWYCTVLNGTTWYCMVLHGIARYCMVLHGVEWFFLSWHAAKSFIKNLTLESFIPTSMLSINKKTMRLGVTSNASKVPDILGDTGSWRHLPRHLVRFSHAFPLDSFSRAAWTRSHVRCWQLSSLGKNLEFRYLQVMLIDIIRFTIPTP